METVDRYYQYCVKDAVDSPHFKGSNSTGWVCPDHLGTPGAYIGCATCGKRFDGPSMNYVCAACLKVPVTA